MFNRKFLNIVITLMVLTTLVFGTSINVTAKPANMPTGPTDGSKVPHYFGPYPNWANSPLTMPTATVTIQGNGTGAAAVAVVDPLTQGISSIQITSPGTGYTNATVSITGNGTGATASATVNTTGAVTSVTVDVAGGGYTSPQVSFSGGGGVGVVVPAGNPLIDRAYATDNASSVFVVLPTALPTGQLQSFQTLNQALAGGSSAPSAALSFNAFVLRPTGIANEYQVVFDSGLLTVPALTNPSVSEIATFPVNVAVQAGDVLAFYGQGVPMDIGAGSDILSYPAPLAPVQGNLITLGGAEFPVLAQARTYSFGAQVLDLSMAPPVTQATATAYGGVDAVQIGNGGFGLYRCRPSNSTCPMHPMA